MGSVTKAVYPLLVVLALLSFSAAPARAQGKVKHKHYVVAVDRAVSVTRTVLVHRGFAVVRVDRVGPTHVVYYRRVNARGRPKGPMYRLVIRRLRDRVVFEEAEPSVLVDIDLKLKL
jgi:hypothetical protein